MEVIPKKKLSKDILNFIRTTMRNNIELTHIADNKANVLLTLNALMLTFLLPFAIPYFDVIKDYSLEFPIFILVMTCIITIYISTLVLKPARFDHNKSRLKKGKRVSPFFFGNFYKMDRSAFQEYIKEAVSDPESVGNHIIEDLHYFGARLGEKMSWIRIAFNVFMIGFFISISLAIIIIFFFN